MLQAAFGPLLTPQGEGRCVTYIANGAAERARWQVLWIKDRRVHKHDCGQDFGEAVRVYALVVKAGRQGATIRCCNMGFPPPPHLQPKEVVFNPPRRVGSELVRSAVVIPLRKLNAAGWWWCPYCSKMRRFVKKPGFYVDSIWVDEPSMSCPMCGINHRDFHVRKWNPIAARISARVRDPNRKRRRRRRQGEDDGD